MDIYEGLNAYKTYVAVRNHFKQDSYDYIKYNGKSRVGADSYLKRNDRYFFAKLQRNLSEHELVYFFVANFIADESNWSGSLVTINSMNVYNEWKKTIESLSYLFKQDCLILKEAVDSNGKNFDNLFDCQRSHPPLLKLYLGKHIRVETMVIIDRILHFSKVWSKELEDDIVWTNVRRLTDKYGRFVQVDTDKFKSIMQTTFI
jgi:hypothetical protein